MCCFIFGPKRPVFVLNILKKEKYVFNTSPPAPTNPFAGKLVIIFYLIRGAIDKFAELL